MEIIRFLLSPLMIELNSYLDMLSNSSYLVRFFFPNHLIDSSIEQVIFYPNDPSIILLFINYWHTQDEDDDEEEVMRLMTPHSLLPGDNMIRSTKTYRFDINDDDGAEDDASAELD